ncbi:hypothetical protein [Kordia aestuariivivens]|nr:hypothetical protein [Kordia aestuariivivens]
MEKFKKFQLPNVTTVRIIGGNGEDEEGPITNLGTVTNEGDA